MGEFDCGQTKGKKRNQAGGVKLERGNYKKCEFQKVNDSQEISIDGIMQFSLIDVKG